MRRSDNQPRRNVAGAKPSILWITNLAAPYRLPVWQHLADQHVLTVALLESNAGLRRDTAANRGDDWLHRSTDEIIFEELPSWKYHHGEARYYVLKSLRSLFIVRKFDIIVFGGWESPAYWSLLASSILFRTARVGFYESPANTMTYRSGPVAWIRSKFFRSMDAIVVPGEAAAEAVRGMGVPPNRIFQGFNAVDVSKFNEASVRSPRGSSAVTSGHRYLYVGRLIPLKRVDAIITAFAQIAGPNDELTIVGAGALREELRTLTNSIKSKIHFLEHTENRKMPAIMAMSQTLVLASEREVWGLVVNEALASGMHVVVTDNCGVVPSVCNMRGVHVTKADLTDLSDQMLASKAGWAGRIAAPEILQHTPERFAAVFGLAFGASLAQRRNSTGNGEKEVTS